MNFKNTLRLMATTFLVALATTSCEEAVSDDDSKDPVDKVESFTLKTKGSSVNNLSVEVTVTNDDVENYVVAMMTKTNFVREYDSDLEAAAAGATDALIADKSIDCAVVDDQYVFSGDATVDLASVWDLNAGTSYVVLTYGVDGLGGLTTAVAWKNVSTQRESQYSEYVDYLFINEVDPNDDWVEIYNNDRESIELDGFYLKNKAGDRVELSGKVSSSALVSFDCSVNGRGDSLTLYDGDDKIVDDVEIPSDLGVSSSYGRTSDGAEEWKEFTTPSRDGANGMVGGGDEAYTVTKLYSTEEAIAFEVTPSESVKEYNFTYITVPEELFNANGEEGFSGDINILADYCAAYFQSLMVDFTSPDGSYIYSGEASAAINAAFMWIVEPNTDYVTAVFAVDKEGNRVTVPVRYDSTSTGSYESTEKAYSQWLGNWTVDCLDTEGNPLTMDVSIAPLVEDYSYVVKGFEVSALRSECVQIANRMQGTYSDTGEAFDMLSFNSESTIQYGEDPELGMVRIYYSAFCAAAEYPAGIFISGNYPAIYGPMNEDGKSATLVGYEGQYGSGKDFNVLCMAPAVFAMEQPNGNNFYGYNNDDEYGGADSQITPSAPFTFTKSDASSAPRKSYSTPNIYRSAMNKALNAPFYPSNVKRICLKK